jgi:RNA polymerase sigma-70 factor (ECF subfamily)
LRHSDEELVRRVLDGDTAAFAELVERYRDAAFGVGLHVLGDPHAAAEVAQDAFMRAYRALGQLREPARFPAWLCTIARNLSRTRLAARAAAASDVSLEEVAEMPGMEKSPPENAEESEVAGIVRKLVETLPDEQRLAFTLFYVNGYSYADLSQMLDLPEGTVKSQLARARSRLKRGFVEMAKDTLQQEKPDAEFWRSATGTICGRVTSAATGEPVGGAEVKLYETQTVTFATARSDAAGVWEATDLPPGAYSPSCRHAEFVPLSGLDWGNITESVVVRPGQAVRGIDFALQPAAVIRGKVVTGAGAAVSGASVCAWRRMEPPSGEMHFEQAGNARTDEEGRFEIGRVPAGTYLVGAHVCAEDELFSERPTTYHPATFSLYDSRWVTTSHDAPSEEITIALAEEGTARLKVAVVAREDRRPVGGASVLVCRRDIGSDIFQGHTDQEGRFETDFLTPGPFQVLVDASGQGYPRWSKWIDVPRRVRQVDLEFTLPRGATVEGRVVTEDGSELPTLEHFSCSLHPVRRDKEDSGLRTFTIISFVSDDKKHQVSVPYDEGPPSVGMQPQDGGLLISQPVAPGKVSVNASIRDRDWRVVDVRLEGEPPGGPRRIECRPGERVEGLVVTLGTNLGVVAGRAISEEDGRPMEGTWVHLNQVGGSPSYRGPARADRSGSFFFHSVPAGAYEIALAPSDVDPVNAGSKREITVEPGKVVHLDLAMPSA